jgi:hypothetical protein
VRDEQHRLARLELQPADLVLHVAPDERVERAERLVVEHQLRVDGERAGEADALLHPARELVGEHRRRVLQADEPQHLAGALQPLCLRYALDLEPEAHVLDDRAVRQQPEVLEDHRDRVPAQLAQCRAVGGHHVRSQDLDRTRGGLDEPDQRADERRLARPGQAHHDEHLAGPDVERDVADRHGVARLRPQLGAGERRVVAAHDALGVGSEDLPEPACLEERRAAPVDRVGGLAVEIYQPHPG